MIFNASLSNTLSKFGTLNVREIKLSPGAITKHRSNTHSMTNLLLNDMYSAQGIALAPKHSFCSKKIPVPTTTPTQKQPLTIVLAWTWVGRPVLIEKNFIHHLEFHIPYSILHTPWAVILWYSEPLIFDSIWLSDDSAL